MLVLENFQNRLSLPACLCWQAAAKLKDMEDSMLKYYDAHADKAGVGLECLPGVKQLLQELKVHASQLPVLFNFNHYSAK